MAGLARAAEDSSFNSRVEEFDVGVVLDFETWVGKISYSCMSMALADFYAAHPNCSTRLVLHPRDSKVDVVAAASAGTVSLVPNLKLILRNWLGF